MEPHNFLPDHLNVSRPELLEEGVIFSHVTQGCNIITERINPHVHHVLRVARNLYPPVERRPGNSQIFKPRLNEVVEHLLFPGCRQDELRMFVVVLNETVSIPTHLKEVAILFNELNLMPRRGLPANHFSVVIPVYLS